MNEKALLLLALTLIPAAFIIVNVAVTPDQSLDSPNDTSLPTGSPDIRLVGETIGDPTSPGCPIKT